MLKNNWNENFEITAKLRETGNGEARDYPFEFLQFWSVSLNQREGKWQRVKK